MSSMQSAYLIIGGFALVAFFIHMEWLFYLLLLAFAALLVSDSLSQMRRHEAHGYSATRGGHHSEPVKPVHAPPASFFDVLLANLIANKHTSIQDEHRRHKEHEEHKKHEEAEKKEKAEEKKEHKHELEETKKHLEAQLKKIEDKIFNTNKDGKPPSVVKELQEQRKLLKEKLDEIIQRL